MCIIDTDSQQNLEKDLLLKAKKKDQKIWPQQKDKIQNN